MGLPLHLLLRKFVLVIGDEGAVLVHVVRGNVKDAWFVPADSEEGPEAIREFLLRDKKAPLVVEADVVEQLYREELLPKTNFLDHPKVLKRRLDIAFPGEEMKSARPLPKKGPAGQKAFLFMALPMNDWLKKWVAFLDTVSNPVDAFALLPMESIGLVESLAPEAEAQTEKHWRIFVSQEVTGGFRQIIQMNGQFILARMTPKPAEEDTAEDISQLIEREFKSSISYIKRLGYQETDHLDLVVVASAAIRDQLHQRELPVTSLSILTPFEAGKRLGYEKVADPESPYSDVLHAVWLARKRKAPILLSTPPMAKKRQMRQIEQALPVLAALVTIGQFYYAGDIALTNYELSGQIDGKKATMSERESRLRQLQDEMSLSEIPFERLTTMLSAKHGLERMTLDWPGVLMALEQSLDGQAVVTKFDLDVDVGGTGGAKKADARQAKPTASSANLPFKLEVAVRFIGVGDNLAEVVASVKGLESRLKDAFPGADIEVKDMPANVKSEGTFSSRGKTLETKATKEISATYLIRKGG